MEKLEGRNPGKIVSDCHSQNFPQLEGVSNHVRS